MQRLKLTQNKEEAFIEKYFLPLTLGSEDARKLKDDVAALGDLIIKTDNICEGIHVKVGTSPAKIARKLMARNLSDIASKGGCPIAYTLSIFKHINFSEDFIAEFTKGLSRFQIPLIGGDVTGSSNSMFCASITMFARKTIKEIPSRWGAQEGDFIYITGQIGRAFLGYLNTENFLSFYEEPDLQIDLMQKLYSKYQINSSIDVSDGFLKDIISLLNASQVGAEVDINRIPMPDFKEYKTQMLTFGDDYEIIFTSKDEINEDGVSKIGIVTNENDLKLLNASGLQFKQYGYTF